MAKVGIGELSPSKFKYETLQISKDFIKLSECQFPLRKFKHLHLVLGRPLGRFPVGVTGRTCLANLSWGILDTWPNQPSWNLSIRRGNGSTFRAENFIIAHFVAKYHTVNSSGTPESGSMTRILLPWFSKWGQRGRRCLLITVSLDNFTVYQDRLWKVYCSTQKIQNVFFYNFCYYFWGQHCCWTETSITFFCFYKFPFPSTLSFPPCPTAILALELFTQYLCFWLCKYLCIFNKLPWASNIYAYNNKQAQTSHLIARHGVLLKIVFCCFHFCSVHVQQLSHWEKLYSR